MLYPRGLVLSCNAFVLSLLRRECALFPNSVPVLHVYC